MIGGLIWAASPLFALAGAWWLLCRSPLLAIAARVPCRAPSVPAPPSLYERHYARYVESGDLAELQLALCHVEPQN